MIAPIVIGGCGSSGTTLLRQMLDRHPAVFCGPESTLFIDRTTSDRDLADRFGFEEAQVRRWRTDSLSKVEFIERFQAACLARSGKTVWAEKTPENIRHFPAIVRRFPRAKLVHMIRDGRDVACSLRQAEWMKLEKITGGAARNSPEAFEACVRYWIERVEFGRSLKGSSRYHEIHYEDLVGDPERTLRALLAFAGLDWDSRVLVANEVSPTRDGRPIYRGSAGRWLGELTQSEGAIIERRAGPILRELGYVTARDWTSALPAMRQAGSRAAKAPAERPSGVRRVLKGLRREALAFGLALGDGRAPVGPRLIGGLAALYAAAPADLIADSRPVVGCLDDLLVAALAVPLMARLMPAELKAQHRVHAALLLSRRTWAVGNAGERLRGGAQLGRWTAPVVRSWRELRGWLAGASYVVDADLRFVSVNAEALRAWGRPVDDVLGRRLLEVFPTATPENYRAHLEALKTSRAQRLKMHSRVLDRPVQVAIRPLSDGLRVQFAPAGWAARA